GTYGGRDEGGRPATEDQRCTGDPGERGQFGGLPGHRDRFQQYGAPGHAGRYVCRSVGGGGGHARKRGAERPWTAGGGSAGHLGGAAVGGGPVRDADFS